MALGFVDDDRSPPVGDATARCVRVLAATLAAVAVLFGCGVATARAADDTGAEAAAATAVTTTSTTTPEETTAPPAVTTTAEATPSEPAQAEPVTTEPPAQPTEPPAQPEPMALLAVTPPAPPPAVSLAAPPQPVVAGAGLEAVHASFTPTVELAGPTLPADLTWPADAGSPARHSIRHADPARERRAAAPQQPRARFAVAAPPAARAPERGPEHVLHTAAHRPAEHRAAEPPGRPPALPQAHPDGSNDGTVPGSGSGAGGGFSSLCGLRASGPAAAPLVLLAPTTDALHVDEVLRLRIERPG